MALTPKAIIGLGNLTRQWGMQSVVGEVSELPGTSGRSSHTAPLAETRS